MSIIDDIVGYFPKIGSYIEKTNILYNQIAPIVDTLSNVKDCEIFPPTGEEIKNELRKNGQSSILSTIEDLSYIGPNENSFFIDDPEILQNQRIGNVIQNLNNNFYNSIKNNNNLLNDSIIDTINKKEVSIGDPCKILDDELNDAVKRQQKINNDFIKVLDEDSNAFKVLNRCKVGSPLLEDLKNPEIWTSEDLQTVIDNCITPLEPEIGLSNDSTEAPKYKSINEDYEEAEETPTEGENASLKEIFENLSNAFSALDAEDGAIDCAKKIFEATEFLNESTQTQIEEDQIISDLQFDLEYETLFNEGLRGMIKGVEDVWIVSSIGIGVSRFVPKAWKDYSKEITVKNKEIDFIIRSAKVPVAFEKNEDEKTGKRFDIEQKFADEVSGKSFENFDDIDSKVKAKEKKTKELFERYKEISYREGINLGEDLGSKFITFERTQIIKTLKSSKRKSDERLISIQNDLNKYKRRREEREIEVANTINELNELGCNSNERVAEEEPDENTDFRGVTDPKNPTIYDDDYWKKFANLATIVGLLPIPQFTGSNDFKVQFTGSSAEVKLPKGGIAIDDDGIPRFLFWPIGLVIPVPKPPDFLIRIPLPMIWTYLAKFQLKNPLHKLEEKLLEKVNVIEPLRDAAFLVSDDDPLQVAYSKLPNNSIDSILKLMGANALPVLAFAFGKIAGVNDKILNIVKSEIFNYARNNAFQTEQIITTEGNKSSAFLNSLTSSIALRLQSEIQPIINEVNTAILDVQSSVDFSLFNTNVESFINDLRFTVQTAEDLINAFGSCLSIENTLEGATDFIKGANNAIKQIRDITDYGLNTNFNLNDLTVPFLEVDEYLGVSNTIGGELGPFIAKIEEYVESLKQQVENYKNNVSDDINDIKDFLDDKISEYSGEVSDYISNILQDFEDSYIYEMFPDLKKFSNFLSGAMLKNLYNIIRGGLINANFDFRNIMNLPGLDSILINMPILQLNYADLLFVFFIGFSGPIPYPFLLCINMSNILVSGVINANAMSFIVTADFINPIKKIKDNWGSRVIPIPTQIEGLINTSMGIGYSYGSGATINVCDSLGNLDVNLQTIIDELIKPTPMLLNYLQNLPKRDLYNLIEWPNPNALCKVTEAENFKEAFKKSLNSVKLKNSTIPPSFTKVKTAISNGLPNLNGELKIDELKDTFGLESFPDVADVLPMDPKLKTNLLFSEMGITSSAIFDLFPEISKAAPYIQDDLPVWERLHLGNVPFVFFLAEFLVAAKRGAKFPIPEVLPFLEM